MGHWTLTGVEPRAYDDDDDDATHVFDKSLMLMRKYIVDQGQRILRVHGSLPHWSASANRLVTVMSMIGNWNSLQYVNAFEITVKKRQSSFISTKFFYFAVTSIICTHCNRWKTEDCI